MFSLHEKCFNKFIQNRVMVKILSVPTVSLKKGDSYATFWEKSCSRPPFPPRPVR